MKNTLNNSVREMRKQDVIECFYKAFKEVRKEKPFATQNDIIKHAVNSNYNQQNDFFAKIKTKRPKSDKIAKRNGC